MKEQQLNYYELEPEDNTFVDVAIDITHRCNMVCKNCYIPNRDIPDMDVDRMIDAISRFPKRTMIRIMGAEPTMRRDLTDIIVRIRAAGHRCTLLTNGLRLASRPFVRQLKQSKLSHIYLSLNGVDNDDWYEEIDELRCATKKIQALENIASEKFILDTGTILVKGINDDAPSRMMSLLQSKEINHAVCRFKNVGQVGRWQAETDENFTVDEMVDLISSQLQLSKDYIYSWQDKPMYGMADPEPGSFMFPIDPESVNKPLHRSGIWIRIVDWDCTDKPTPFMRNKRRGRLTQDFKVAPFSEHVYLNEGGY